MVNNRVRWTSRFRFLYPGFIPLLLEIRCKDTTFFLGTVGKCLPMSTDVEKRTEMSRFQLLISCISRKKCVSLQHEKASHT